MMKLICCSLGNWKNVVAKIKSLGVDCDFPVFSLPSDYREVAVVKMAQHRQSLK